MDVSKLGGELCKAARRPVALAAGALWCALPQLWGCLNCKTGLTAAVNLQGVLVIIVLGRRLPGCGAALV